jgi:hypothetical protein
MLLLIYKELKQDFYKDPVTSDIDSIAVTFNDVNQTLAANLSNTKTQLIKAAKDNNIQSRFR